MVQPEAQKSKRKSVPHII